MIRAILLAIVVLVIPCDAIAKIDYYGTNNIQKIDDFIFGYGSLVNSDSRTVSLNKDITVIPARISSEFGYVRSWNYRASHFTALGLRKAKSGEKGSINGIIYPVLKEEFAIWDKRESEYNRVQVPLKYIEAASWIPIPEKANIWIYVPKAGAEVFSDYSHPILQSYMDVCLSGFLEYSDEFAREFVNTTFDWSEFILNDRLLARRPWVYNKHHDTIDRILLDSEKSKFVIEQRSFISTYDDLHSHSPQVNELKGMK